MVSNFEIRALEIHSIKMWDEEAVLQALDFIERYEMNALVFHGTDIVHTITFPRKYFGQYVTWDKAPPRRGENAIFNNRSYIANISRLCSSRNISFYLEVKEIAFPEEILEHYPDLMKDGILCPSDPRWVEFLEIKYDELFHDFPQIKGVIVSLGSQEGRVSMAAGRCRCERCQSTTLPDWYRDITLPLQRAANKYKRELIVREFSYNPEDQQAVIDGLAKMPDEVGFMVKVYPHDFYPTFPDNLALDALPERFKWIEYDVHGQYYGWGVFPCLVAEDIKQRFEVALNKGARGVIMRTDWERVNDLYCLDTLNILNLAAGAVLAKNIEAEPVEILTAALIRENFINNSEYSAAELQEVASTLMKIWSAYSKALYIQGFVFNSSSKFPARIDHAWWTMLDVHSLHKWFPDAIKRLDFSSREAIDVALREKDEALAEIKSITKQLMFYSDRILRLPRVNRIEAILPLMERYVEGFVHCGRVVILAKVLKESPHAQEYRAQYELAVKDLENYHSWLSSWSDDSLYSHHVYMLMDEDRIASILKDAHDLLNNQSVLGKS